MPGFLLHAGAVVMHQSVIEIDHAAYELRRKNADAAIVEEIEGLGPALGVDCR